MGKKEDKTMWIVGFIVSLSSCVLSVYSLYNTGSSYSGLLIGVYLFYLFVSCTVIACSVRKREKTQTALIGFSVFNTIFALICIEIVCRLCFGTDTYISLLVGLLVVANFPIIFFLSAFFVRLLSCSERTNIEGFKNDNREKVYAQISQEYTRLLGYLTRLNSYNKLRQIENRRFDYISMFPGVTRQACDNARSKALRGILSGFPAQEKHQLETCGFDAYYTVLNQRLYNCKMAQSDYEGLRSTADITSFSKKYNSFIRI